MNTYSRLTSAQGAQSKSLEKLSSGLRINRAGDDAAGLAISEKMRGQIKGLNQSVRNAQDGISLIQTAEGALNETHSILNRMRELAVQSSNDTNTDTDRIEIQKEMDQLATEITRISSDTEFNTQKLLNGNFDAKFHIGANKGQNMRLQVEDMGASALGVQGSTSFKQSVSATAVANHDYDTTEVALAPNSTATGTATHNLTAVKLESKITDSGTDYNYGLKNSNGDIVALSVDGKSYDLLNAAGSKETLNGSSLTGVDINFGANAVTSGDVSVTMTTGADTSDVTINATGKTDIELSSSSSIGAGTYSVVDSTHGSVPAGSFGLANSSGNIVALSADGDDWTSFESGEAVFTAATTLANGDEITISGSGIDVSSQVAADAAIKTIDDAITAVSAERSKLGAVQNRLDHTINNLTTTSENLSAAESRIRDVDMAKEMMEFTKNNILNQASTAMLAQANQMPQGVLQLLG